MDDYFGYLVLAPLMTTALGFHFGWRRARADMTNPYRLPGEASLARSPALSAAEQELRATRQLAKYRHTLRLIARAQALAVESSALIQMAHDTLANEDDL